jgi:Ca-activated chloride channel family protein
VEWRNPSYLVWLIPITAVWLGLFVWAQIRNHHGRRQLLHPSMSVRLMAQPKTWRMIAKGILQGLAVVASILGLAGPQFGETLETAVPKGSDIYVLLDVSRSMLATDVVPSRLERAKSDVSALVNRLRGERIGLIAFAGQAVVKCPLTMDYESFKRSLAEIDTNSAPKGGTAIGDAIRKAMEVFSASGPRNQSLLLFTDGDDQESRPLEAAEFAAERQVAIFAIGLGDATQGARVPTKSNSGAFVEYGGEQVWSKLDNSLLEKIATSTMGVYIPAGTQSYDLGEIYADYLEGRTSDDSQTQQRVRKADQYQWFLAMGLIAFLAERMVRLFDSLPHLGGLNTLTTASRMVIVSSVLFYSAPTIADTVDSNSQLQNGVRLYRQNEFSEARDAFKVAAESLQKDKADSFYVSLFDQACAEHRLGNREVAEDLYLKSAMSRDKKLGANAHFNLAKLHVETMEQMVGDSIDQVENENRENILSKGREAITAYRTSLELDPSNGTIRRNIEIVRQWLKQTTDRWQELDRQKRRNEADLLQFLEFLIQSEKSIYQSSSELQDLYSLDEHMELKRAQDELAEELPYLREKIESAFDEPENQSNPGTNNRSVERDKQTQEAIDLLLNWVDTARDYMREGSRSLGEFHASQALEPQRLAIEEFEKLWESVAPYEPLLAKAFEGQTKIVNELSRADDMTSAEEVPKSLSKDQLSTQKLARLLAPKAQAALTEIRNSQRETASDAEPNGMPEEDPQKQRRRMEALEKGIELAPRAVDAMESAVSQLKSGNPMSAYKGAEEARSILEELMKALQDPEGKKRDQEKQDSESQTDPSKNNSSDDDKKEQGKSDREKQQEQNKSDPNEQDKDTQKNEANAPVKNEANKEPPPNGSKLSKDRLEEALRKVRERESEKRERDKQLRVKALGRPMVEKDW